MAAGENWENVPRVLAGTKIDHEPRGAPSTLRRGMTVAFRGFCRDVRDIFRLARIYNVDDSAAAGFAFFESPDNSCFKNWFPQVGIMRERVSASYVINGKRRLAHIWRVEAADGEMVFVIVAEKMPGGRDA